MDAGTLSNVFAIVFSALALALSILFTRRQLKLSHGSNMMILLGSTFTNLRTPAFFDAQEYIYENMHDHDPALGYKGLPADVRTKLNLVTHFYNDLGRLVVHGALEEGVVLSSFGEGILQTWMTLQTYIEAERLTSPVRFMLYYEDMACRMREKGQYNVGSEYNLRQW